MNTNSRTLSTYIYLKAFDNIKGLLYLTKGDELWFRNSLYFNKISFLKSDIDLTLVVTQISSAKHYLDRIKELKKFIPIIGETNAYLQSHFHIYQDMNFYELKRDPLLFIKLNVTRTPTEFEKVVFLTHMLRSNENKLFSRKKWNFYFSHVDIKNIELNNYQDVITAINTLLKDNSLPTFRSIGESFNPVKDFSKAIYDQNFSGYLEEIKSYSNQQRELLVQELKWEIFGVYSQIFTSFNYKNIINHYLHIKEILIHIEESELVKNIDSILLFLKELSKNNNS